MQSVPVIDISDLNAQTLGAIDAACRGWGFFQVVGHGIAPHLLSATLTEMQRFFALPAQEKQQIERTPTNFWGYYDRELTKNVRDWKEIFDVGPAEGDGPLAGSQPQWPEGLPGFRTTLEAFADACHAVALELIRVIGLNLGRPGDTLTRHFGPTHSSFLRLNHYPPCDNAAPADAPTRPSEGHLGINHHTDAGAVTVLLQDAQPGLQVLRDERWYIVEPNPGALVINVGDIAQVWSNDEYQAPLHRVLASSDVSRYSAPYFCNPSYDTSYEPLLAPPRYQAINWGEFRAGRAAGDYSDSGEEIQISHFRI